MAIINGYNLIYNLKNYILFIINYCILINKIFY